jgi:hypothetical protein
MSGSTSGVNSCFFLIESVQIAEFCDRYQTIFCERQGNLGQELFDASRAGDAARVAELVKGASSTDLNYQDAVS